MAPNKTARKRSFHAYSIPLALLLLLVLLVSGGWGIEKALAVSAGALEKSAQNTISSAQAGQWEKANAGFDEMEQYWHKIRKFWPMLIHHQEMDRIEESMSKIKSYLRHRESSDAEAELNNLIHYIQHIPEKEEFNFQNVL